MFLYYATKDDPEIVNDILTNGIQLDDDGVIALCDTMTIAGQVFIDANDYREKNEESGYIQLAVFKCDVLFTDDDGIINTFGGYDVEGLGVYGYHENIPPADIIKDVNYLGFGDEVDDDTPPRSPEEYRERIDDKEQRIIDALGYQGALEEISKALSYDTKQDIYDYIIRCHELEEVTQ